MVTETRPSADRQACLVPAIGLALVAILAISLFLWLRSGKERLPDLTAAGLAEARATWRSNGVPDYDISVSVSGRQAATYTVHVRDGIPIRATHNGRDLRDQRTFGTWSVPGMFETIQRDVDANEQHGYLLLRAAFDAKYGFPRGYERIEMRTGAHDALQWRVNSFALRGDGQESTPALDVEPTSNGEEE